MYVHVDVYLILYNIYFFFLGAEEEEEAVAAAVVEIEDAEAVEAEVVEEVAAVIEIIKTVAIILAKTWTISSLNTPDMDIENVTRIIETQEDIREVAVGVAAAVAAAVEVEEVEEAIAEIPAQITVRIIVKITVRVTIINSRSIPVREIRMEAIIEAAETIIRIGGKVGDGEAEFKVDGIKVPIIPM